MYIRNLRNCFKTLNFVFSKKHINIYSLPLHIFLEVFPWMEHDSGMSCTCGKNEVCCFLSKTVNNKDCLGRLYINHC